MLGAAGGRAAGAPRPPPWNWNREESLQGRPGREVGETRGGTDGASDAAKLSLWADD